MNNLLGKSTDVDPQNLSLNKMTLTRIVEKEQNKQMKCDAFERIDIYGQPIKLHF